MIIDVHAHIWKNNYAQSGRALIETANRYGVDRIYVSGLGELIPDEAEIRDLNDHVSMLSME